MNSKSNQQTEQSLSRMLLDEHILFFPLVDPTICFQDSGQLCTSGFEANSIYISIICLISQVVKFAIS